MRFPSLLSFSGIYLFLLPILSYYITTSSAQSDTQYVTYTNTDGETLYLPDDREPSLYTREYGDCQGDSVITVTRFDAAYYKDNMTIVFHLGGYTAVANESVIMYIGVYAYGENRFNLTFDPCFANIRSMCPINASVPIDGSGIIPIAPADVANIPDLALSIPDFEGQAILRIFGNSTQSQIACYSAILTNGNTFSHPTAIGSTVGAFVAFAFVASLVTAIYGQSLQETRIHYAHSLSMFVVFSILQHVFFTGALSMNFPSVLVAFWSNFGWASGMIYTSTIQDSINQFVGNDRGNISTLGSAASGETAVNLGGGYSLSSIYRRALEPMQKRADAANATYTSASMWYGALVDPGLPLPGNYSSFAGTLAELRIPASNAFLTGLIWFLVLIALMLGIVILVKAMLELFAASKLMKTERLTFFRRHWIYCAGIVALRTCYIAFFMMVFLSLFQFTIGGGSGPLAIAGIVFCLAMIGMLGLSGYALWYRLGDQHFRNNKDRLQLKQGFGWTRESTAREKEDPRRTLTSIPWRGLHFVDPLQRPHAHDDQDYLIKFGWLSARFRRSKWWFFSAWLAYELVRACFYGAAAGSPLIQVFGLLVWESLSLFAIVIIRPFESSRLNMLMVYFLGFSKVTSTALCAAFDPRFRLGRILTTVIGIIIIVIQGVLIICMLIAIVIGCISSWMSVRRYKQDFRPRALAGARTRYFAHIEQKATDRPIFKQKKVKAIPLVDEEPKEPYFSVTDVRRQTKIEDDTVEKTLVEEDATATVGVDQHENAKPPSRAASIRSRNSMSTLPYGARKHRASWSTRDFQNTPYDTEHLASGIQSRMSIDSIRDINRDSFTGTPTRNGASSVRHSWTHDPSLVDVANAAVERPPDAYRSKHAKSRSTSHPHLQRRFTEEAVEQIVDRPATGAA